MPTFGFLIDNRKCIGCHACTVACKSEHEVPIGVDRTWVKYIEKGAFPNSRRMFSVMRCNHCEYAPCVTICPVTALYHRDDGVVDFNSDRCIGCKACMQACPYDALYIDPQTDTAAKCNFCTHRLDAGLEPSCVVVCPEQAIVCGDLDDPQSKLSQLIERHPVQVRKPEKGTRPKLYYIEGDEASLIPHRTQAEGRNLWSRGEYVTSTGEAAVGPDPIWQLPIVAPATATAAPAAPAGNGVPPGIAADHASSARTARRVYDVRPRAPAWGWPVALYTWTKSIAAGSMMAVLVASHHDPADVGRVGLPLGLVGLVFLAITTALLVLDLKQPKRFLYVLLRPQWGSWLVRGAYILVAYGLLLSLWLACRATGAETAAAVLLWPTVLFAVPAAVYTAFLFSQAKGRDLWQSPLLSVHLLAHALLAGGAVWLLVEGADSSGASRTFMFGVLVFSLLAMLGEIFTTPPTEDARRAIDMILGREYGAWFWGVGIGLGHLAPLALLATDATIAASVAAVLALVGMLAIERLWVLAPQRIPLS